MTAPLASPSRLDDDAPPPLPGRPLLGSVLEVARDPLTFFVRGYERMGPVYRFRALGREAIVLAGRDTNRFVAKHASTVLTSAEYFRDFGRVYDARVHLPGAEGETHARLRRLLGPTIGRRVGMEHRDALSELTRELVSALPDEAVVDAVDFVRRLVGIQLGATLAGKRADASFEALRYVLQVMLDVTVAKRSPAFRMRLPRYRRMKAEVDRLSRAVISEHRARSVETGRGDVIDAVLRGEREGFLDPNDVTLLSMMPYQAGLDTVSHTLAFALYHLVADRALHAEVRDEVDRAYRTRDAEGLSLTSMPLLGRVVKETLRLHPVAFALMRHAARDFEVAGHRVRQGRHVIVATTVSHFDPSCFADPWRFDPSRFDEARSPRPPASPTPPTGSVRRRVSARAWPRCSWWSRSRACSDTPIFDWPTRAID